MAFKNLISNVTKKDGGQPGELKNALVHDNQIL